MSLLTGLDHIAIAVEDLAAAQRRTIRLLGRTPAWVGGHPEHGVRSTRFRLANTDIELLAPVAEGHRADALRGHLEARGEGLYGLVFASDDLQAAVGELRRRGLAITDPIPGLSQDGPSGAYRRFAMAAVAPSGSSGVRTFVAESYSLAEEMSPSLALEGEDAAVESVDHVVVMSRDPDRAVDFYGTQLGIRLALDKRFEARGLRLLFFRVGGLTIEVGAQIRVDAELEPPPSSDDHLWGLALRVPEIDAARARVAASGLEVSDVRAGHKPGTRVCTLSGEPNGVATLLIQAVADVRREDSSGS